MIIGLTGRAGAGKDTAAALLRDHYGPGAVEIMSFARPIKDGIKAMFGLDGRHTDGELKEVPIPWLGGRTPRYLMQTLGTEFGRELVHPDVWVHAALARAARSSSPLVVFTDARFGNEALAIRDKGGVIVRVNRSGHLIGKDHPSEVGLPFDLVDHEINNNGTTDDLARELIRVLPYEGAE